MKLNSFVERLLAHLGIDGATVKIDDQGEVIFVEIAISEEDSGILIGYHGETLGALQKILSQVSMQAGEEKKIVVNINDYKQRRETQLKELAQKAGEKVLQTGRAYVFSFLPANERLIIHQTISQLPEFKELESVSTGEGKDRRLEIRLRVETSAKA